ncbi:Uncharacterized protein FWK35_00017489 [Aphis craccivora]|uniref:BESS domain-containing protein n=1 Tax=Aphis craccivora TaxID=307492 RepID=A0A6G0Y1U3_APHCR|nr:Uncharacterized protein FWK35_00017489 [Aphis craccivora]
MSTTYENDSVEVESIDATDNFFQFDIDENSGGEIVLGVVANKCDEDLMFLKSLLPDLKSPPRAQKIRTKIQLQEVLYNAITAVEPTVSTHTFTTPAIINFR